MAAAPSAAGDRTTPARGTRPHRRLFGYSSDRPDRITLGRGRIRAHGGTVAGMPIPRRYTTDAIVLSRFDLGEADRVLTLITPTGGKLKAIAKGVRRPTSRLGRQPRAVRRADRRRWPAAGPSTSSPRSASGTPGSTCATRSNRRRRPGTSPSSPTARSRSATPPSRCTRCCGAPTSCSTRGWRPGRVARWYEMHLLDELGQRPEVDRCVECDRVLEADERFRWVPPLGGVLCERCPGPAARPDRDHASRRSSCSRPTSASTSRRSPTLRLAPEVERETEAALREFVRGALERDARSLAFLDEVRTAHQAGAAGRDGPPAERRRRRHRRGRGRRDAGGAGRRPGAGRPDGGPPVRRPASRRRITRRTGRARCTSRLWVADLHADSLLWGRDLLQRGTRGQVDVPRLIDGNVALQVLAATTQSPRHLNLERNDDRSDDVILLALALGLAAGDVAPAPAARAPPGGPRGRARGALRGPLPGHPVRRPTWPPTRSRRRERPRDHRRPPRDRGRPRARRRPGQRRGRRRRRLPDDVAEPLLRQRVRWLGARRREGRADRRGPRDDRADGGARDARRRRPRLARDDRRRPGHGARARSSPRTPGLRGACDNTRNLTDAQARGDRRRPAASSGSGSGRRPAAATTSPRSPGRSATPSMSPAVEHVALGSDFDGAVPVPFDATGLVAADGRPHRRRLRPTTTSRRSWAATSAGCWPTCCPRRAG